MKRPAPGSILLGLIPFAASCFSVSLWDRIRPIVFGIPFNFFWVISWMILTPVCLWGAYRIELQRELDTERQRVGISEPGCQGGPESGAA